MIHYNIVAVVSVVPSRKYYSKRTSGVSANTISYKQKWKCREEWRLT